jgi:hypothetical protein
MISPMTETEQYQALNVLEYLSDLFTAAEKESFTKTEVLIVLNLVRTDPEIFDPRVVIAQQIVAGELDYPPA